MTSGSGANSDEDERRLRMRFSLLFSLHFWATTTVPSRRGLRSRLSVAAVFHDPFLLRKRFRRCVVMAWFTAAFYFTTAFNFHHRFNIPTTAMKKRYLSNSYPCKRQFSIKWQQLSNKLNQKCKIRCAILDLISTHFISAHPCTQSKHSAPMSAEKVKMAWKILILGVNWIGSKKRSPLT